MPSTETLKIDLREFSRHATSMKVSLESDFFEKLEQEEIIGGHVDVELIVNESAGNIFVVSVEIKGQVIVLCDRCLDELALPVDIKDIIKVYAGDSSMIPSDEDIRILTGNGYEYDLSWDIYELIELSLPIQRVHKGNECNPEMTDRLANYKI